MSRSAWTAVTAVTVFALLSLGLVLRRLYRKLDGFLPPQLRVGYRAEELTFPQDGRQKSLRLFERLFVPMLGFVGLAMAVVAHNAAEILWLRRAMYALTAAARLAGGLEALCLMGRTRRPLRAASVLGYGKWGLFAVWTLCMFAGLFLRAWAL